MPTDSGMAKGGDRLTRRPFVMLSLDLVEQCAERKGALFVYAWLWHYAGRDDAAWPSLDRLALECRMKRDDVRAALKWLTAEGWITREDRPGATSIFHVRTENPSPKRGTPPPDGGTPKRGTPPLPQKGDPTPPPKGATNKKPLTRSLEQEALDPPTPQTEPIATAPAAPDEGAGPSTGKVKLTPADVPADLAPVADLFATWWNHHKGGKRTQRALAVQLTELGKIQADARGGIEAIRAQLQKAITADEIGRRWAGITFDRWLEYGRPAALQVGNGSGGGYRTARERNEEKLDEWVEFIYATDPQYANHPRNQSRTTTATIDWEAMPRA